MAHALHTRLWNRLRAAVLLVRGASSVIPAVPHLERQVLVQESTIHRAVKGVLRGV
ncbi:hypothetical protein ACIBH1_15215 [Nonomuraea sp. NPDC050663]|uniref:hypothetical protein n=1 Tax=Nonomuraea sp. NPDC050663 TaxID=3364370 RepID=UPI0037A9A3E7